MKLENYNMKFFEINNLPSEDVYKILRKYHKALNSFLDRKKILSGEDIECINSVLFSEINNSGGLLNYIDLNVIDDFRSGFSEIEPIYNFIKDNFNEDSIIFEIGVHIGKDTERIKELTGSNFIYGFEPDPRNIQILNERNRLSLFEKFYDCALSNLDGESIFYLSSGHPPEVYKDPDINKEWSASNSLKAPKNHLDIHTWCKFEERLNVKTLRMDHVCNEIGLNKIDLVWMDVQGAEDLVIEGMGEFKNNIRFIYTEYNNNDLYDGSPTLQRIISSLGEGWTAEAIYQNDVLLKNNNI